MPLRHNDLFNDIASYRALTSAFSRAVKGKRRKPGAASFCANLEGEILRLERELNSRTYQPGRYLVIEIDDRKKRRNVSAAPFRDRVVHHALCAVVQPIFERGFIDHSFANRIGKGSHNAVATYERRRDHCKYVLRGDLFRYFPAIDHAILKVEFRRRIACERTLWLLDVIVDGSNAQEPVNLYFPGDDLFSPHQRRRGLPIGNLTSQFFANLYLDRFDHFVTEVLRAPYVRYVDDFAMFHDSPAVLEEWRERAARFLEGRRLRLHPRKTFIAPTAEPAEFLGFVLMGPGWRRLPDDNVRRFRERFRGLEDRRRAGAMTWKEQSHPIGAWVAHAKHANTWRLRTAIFTGGESRS